MSVRRLLAGKADLGRFDLVYSAGLYDYLDDRVAKRLTTSLFRMLEPGGTLLFCNFLRTTADVGYMESFMGWDLIYRDRDEIEGLLGDVDESEIESIHYSGGPGSGLRVSIRIPTRSSVRSRISARMSSAGRR